MNIIIWNSYEVFNTHVITTQICMDERRTQFLGLESCNFLFCLFNLFRSSTQRKSLMSNAIHWKLLRNSIDGLSEKSTDIKRGLLDSDWPSGCRVLSGVNVLLMARLHRRREDGKAQRDGGTVQVSQGNWSKDTGLNGKDQKWPTQRVCRNKCRS